MKNNNYKKSIEIINNSNFTVKGLKTFIGREGHGVNANLYYKGKKVAFLLDSGNGGELDIDWDMNHNDDYPYFPKQVVEAKKHLETLIKSLPKTMWEDLGGECNGLGEYTWDNESVMNTLIDTQLKVKDYNKWLRNVVVFNKETKKIEHYKAKAKDLNSDKYFMVNGVKWGFRNYFAHRGVVLNDICKSEAYDYFNQYK